MKKAFIRIIESLFVFVITVLTLTSCGNFKWFWEKDLSCSTNIEFYKDKNKSEKYETNEFLINTKIFIFTDISITSKCDKDSVIAFEVDIPYSEYYASVDCDQGYVLPTQTEKTRVDKKGNQYSVIILSDMQFLLEKWSSHTWHYIFEISGIQTCDKETGCFETYLTSKDTDVSLSGSKSTANFSFIS